MYICPNSPFSFCHWIFSSPSQASSIRPDCWRAQVQGSALMGHKARSRYGDTSARRQPVEIGVSKYSETSQILNGKLPTNWANARLTARLTFCPGKLSGDLWSDLANMVMASTWRFSASVNIWVKVCVTSTTGQSFQHLVWFSDHRCAVRADALYSPLWISIIPVHNARCSRRELCFS